MSNQALFHPVLKCTRTYENHSRCWQDVLKVNISKDGSVGQINEAFTSLGFISERMLFSFYLCCAVLNRFTIVQRNKFDIV